MLVYGDPKKTMAIDCKSHSVMVDRTLQHIQFWDCSGLNISKQMDCLKL